MLCGWMTTEIGRQPYTVYGVLRTADSVSPIALPGMATSLAVFAVVYFLVFGGRESVILRMMAMPPHPLARRGLDPQGQADQDGGHPRPVSPVRCRRVPGLDIPGSRRSDGPMTAETIAVVWAGLLAFAVLAYVVLDGFDLGVGHPVPPPSVGQEDRDTMVNTIAPVWDGNETWLVLGGGGLFGVFPLAYSVIPSSALPGDTGHAVWPDIPRRSLRIALPGLHGHRASVVGCGLLRRFSGGGVVPGPGTRRAAAGHPRRGPAICGRLVRLADPFTVLCGVAVVVGYAWLGACWLIWRTTGSLQNRARRQAVVLACGMLGLIVAVSIWTPFLNATFMTRWFGWPGILLTSPVPVLVGLVALGFAWGIRRRHHLTPFLCALGIFVLCFAGLGIQLLSADGAADITIWQAAAPRDSQLFVLVGASVLIPLILCYSAFPTGFSAGRSKPVRTTTDDHAWLRRLCWFVALWAAGVLAVGAVAGALHWLLKAV